MNSTELTIRTLNSADAPAFQTLRLAATIDSPAAIWPTYEEQAGFSPEQIEAIVNWTDPGPGGMSGSTSGCISGGISPPGSGR